MQATVFGCLLIVSSIPVICMLKDVLVVAVVAVFVVVVQTVCPSAQ